MTFHILEIAEMIGAVVDGDTNVIISGLAKIEEAQTGQLTFIANPRYEKFIDETQASAVLVSESFPACQKTVLRCADPYFAFLQLVQRFYGAPPQLAKGVHPTAVLGDNCSVAEDAAIGALVVVGDNCRIGRNVQLHPGVVLGDEVEIGDDTLLYANVSVRERCQIGQRVIVHSGAVIGADGFGFAFKDGCYHKIPQTGIVIVEKDVEIGANTTIDRATLGATVIRRGAKLDNLIQIAHNVEVGEHTAIAAQTGISGSTKIGRNVLLGGQVGLIGHIHVGDKAIVGAQSGVTKDIPEGVFVSGYPARPHFTAKREEASLGRLPELLKRVKQLETEMEKLKQQLPDHPGKED